MKTSLFPLVLMFLVAMAKAQTYSQMQIVTTTDLTYSLPGTWNNSDNRVSCLGGGGAGSSRVSSSQGGNGGGGGAWARSTNVNLGAGPIPIQVSTGAGAVSFVKNTGGTIQVQADAGTNASASNGGHGTGGLVANCTGTVKYAGGNGGDSTVADAGAGGGGSGGPSGAGGAGAVGTTINGGSADNGVVAQQTTQGQTGNSGTEFDATHGCGGGGAGGVGGGSRQGGPGGPYGGAGGGCDSGTSTPGAGTAGLVILEWNPAVAPNTGFLQMFSQNKKKENKPCLNNSLSLWRWQLAQLLALSRSILPPSRTH